MRPFTRPAAVFALTTSLLVVCAGPSLAMDYYVNGTNGDDGNSGLTTEDAWKTITHALGEVEPTAWSPATIHVAAGTYGASTNGETFPLTLISDLILAGAGASQTVLDAENTASLIIGCYAVSNVGLRGLSLRSSSRKAVSCSDSAVAMSGCIVADNIGWDTVLFIFRSSFTIETSRISANPCMRPYPDFPAFAIWISLSQVQIRRSQIANNGAGAVLAYNSSLAMSGCSLEDNSGLALYCGESNAWIDNCVIKGHTETVNEPAAVDCYLSTMRLTRCVIAENNAHFGAIQYTTHPGYPTRSSGAQTGRLYIEDSLICDNMSFYGGPIRLNNWLVTQPGYDDMLSVKGCTIVGNHLRSPPPPDYVYIIGNGYNVHFEDNTVAGNDGRLFSSAPGNSRGAERYFQVRNNCLQEEFEGRGNFVADPMFTPGPLGDYYLSAIDAGQDADSPCIDAGSTSASIAGVSNLTTRTDGVFDTGVADIGYHYSATPPTIDCDVSGTGEPLVPGDVLSASIDIENAGLPLWVDVYPGFILPDGNIFCVTPDGLTTDLVPWAATSLLPSHFVLGDIVVFETELPEGLPNGTYTFAAALSLTGDFRPIGDVAFAEFQVQSSRFKVQSSRFEVRG